METKPIMLFMLVAFSALIFAETCTTENLYRCTGSTIEQCLQGNWVSQAVCQPPTVCYLKNGGLDVDCSVQICTPSTSQCADSTHIQYCSGDGMRWADPSQCAPQKTCVQLSPTMAQCQSPPVSCNPGESYCESTTLLKTCNSQGTGWNEESCAGASKVCVTVSPTRAWCDFGTPSICKPAEDKCENNKIYYCNYQGSGWIYQEDCSATGSTCVLDSGTGSATCVAASVCTANTEQRCDPNMNAVDTCNSNGDGWKTTSYCQNNEACVYNRNSKSASCQQKIICTPNYYRCDNDAQFSKCNANGNGWTASGSCPAGTMCTVLNGGSDLRCVPTNTCQNGQTKCDPNIPNQVDICKNNAWEFSKACPADQVCSNGDCVSVPPHICNDGEKRCNPDIPNQVDACQNNAWTFSKTCPQEMVCSNGECVSNPSHICNEGDLRCSPSDGNMVQVCSLNSWQNKESCLYGCFNSACKQCPSVGYKTCATGTSYQVCGEGFNYGAPIACSSGEVCQGGNCTPVSQCTEGAKMCMGNGVYACVLDKETQATSWQLAINCTDTQVCVESGDNAFCKDLSEPAPPISQTLQTFASSGGSSGGGQVSRCSRYSEWTTQSSTTSTETGTDGRTRQCTNSTLVRYCIGDDGKLISSDSQKDSKSTCGDWSEKCEYVYSRTEASTERSGATCRQCSNEIYVYTCQPSGKTYPDNVQTKSTCGNWGTNCPPEVAAASIAGNETGTGGAGTLLKDYGPVFGILVLLLLGIVAYTAWKMFGDDGEREAADEEMSKGDFITPPAGSDYTDSSGAEVGGQEAEYAEPPESEPGV